MQNEQKKRQDELKKQLGQMMRLGEQLEQARRTIEKKKLQIQEFRI